MHSPFVPVKEHFLFSLKEHGLLSEEGDPLHLDKWVKLVNSLPVMVSIHSFSRSMTFLVSESYRDFLQLPDQIISRDEEFAVFKSYDPQCLRYVNSEALSPSILDEGEEFYVTLYDSQLAPFEFSCYAFSFSLDKSSRNLGVLFFCPPVNLRFLKAYALFDFFNLTQRQRETLELMILGKNKKEIAEELDISFKTVEKHFQHVISHAGVETQMELINRLII